MAPEACHDDEDLLTPGINGARRRDSGRHARCVRPPRCATSCRRRSRSRMAGGREDPTNFNAMRQRRYLHRRRVHYGTAPRSCSTSGAARICRSARARAGLRPGAPGARQQHRQGSALSQSSPNKAGCVWRSTHRVAPHHRWPVTSPDVKAAIAWARPTSTKSRLATAIIVAVAGCSAAGTWPRWPAHPDDPNSRQKLPKAPTVRGRGGRNLRPLRLGGRSTDERLDSSISWNGRGQNGDCPASGGVPRRVAGRTRTPECATFL